MKDILRRFQFAISAISIVKLALEHQLTVRAAIQVFLSSIILAYAQVANSMIVELVNRADLNAKNVKFLPLSVPNALPHN